MSSREYIRDILKELGIIDAETLCKWARSKGLLGLYIEFRPHTTFLPGAWQVVRPGEKTDPNTIAVNRGRKTFTYNTLSEKHVAERAARDWTNFHYSNKDWRRIEGFGPNLFPLSVVEELERYIPDLISYENRQQHKYTPKKLTKKKR